MKMKNLAWALACSALLFTATACDDDDDDKQGWPTEVVEGVQNSLKQLFPDRFNSLEIVKMEAESYGYEVDIKDGGKIKEVKLNKQFQWMETEYKVSMAEAMTIIDPAILKKLQDAALKAGMDITKPEIQKLMEVEVHESAAQGLFFEVEIKMGGQELEITIDKDGNFTIGD